MKFPFTKLNKLHIWDCFGKLDLDLLITFMESVREKEEMELIIRKKIDWNATQMKKFFEGPVVDFIQARYADKGVAMGEGEIREGLLAKFLGWTEPNAFGQRHALSRTTLDSPKDGKSPRERWKKFLQDIDQYCLDEGWGGLPSADNTDIGD